MAIEWFKLNLMEVNPDKFQFILFGNSAHKKQEFLELQNVKIQCETSVKLLGVTLDQKLSFNNHINNLAAKAGAQLSALTRIKRYLDESSKLTMAKTFISPTSNIVQSSGTFVGGIIQISLNRFKKEL